jgi:hypothetical protein
VTGTVNVADVQPANPSGGQVMLEVGRVSLSVISGCADAMAGSIRATASKAKKKFFILHLRFGFYSFRS